MSSSLESTGSLHPRSSPQPLYQTLAAPIVVGSSLPSPELEGLGVSEEEYGGQPMETLLCPTSQRGVADGEELIEAGVGVGGGVNTEAGRQKRRPDCLHTSSDKGKTVRSSHHTSFLCLRLLPVCPSLSSEGPQSHNLNDEWYGKWEASAFCVTRRPGEDSVHAAPRPRLSLHHFLLSLG